MVISQNVKQADLESALLIADSRLQVIENLIGIVRKNPLIPDETIGELSLIIAFAEDTRDTIKDVVNGGLPF